MKLFTNDDIRKIDRFTIEEEGVSSRDLIARVAEGVTAEIMHRWRPSKPVTVFAGPGNNGADALTVARLLIEHGYNPEVFLFNIHGLSRDCRISRDELVATGRARLVEITTKMDHPELTENHLVVDGLFGSGLRDSLSGGFMSLVRDINESEAEIVSIDTPSGLFSEWNSLTVARNVVHATVTCAIQFPRIAFLLADNASMVGQWKVLDIGLSQRAIAATPTRYFLIEASDVKRVLRQRADFSSKADYGSVLLYAGSYGMVGAARLAAGGALRAGAGKVTVHSPRCAFNILQTAVPEAMYVPDKNDIVITDMTLPATSRYTGIGIGPGIGTNELTASAIDVFVKQHKRPLVIDADALNCIARRPALLQSLQKGSILTPHPGEFDRIFGNQPSAEARLLKAVEVSARYNLIIVLKGRYTATVRPDGKIFFNSTGNPGMATPGSGDVLTGIITSLLAQGYSEEVSAVAGVFIHGLAGDLAAKKQGTYGVTAMDIVNETGAAIKSIMNQ